MEGIRRVLKTRGIRSGPPSATEREADVLVTVPVLLRVTVPVLLRVHLSVLATLVAVPVIVHAPNAA